MEPTATATATEPAPAAQPVTAQAPAAVLPPAVLPAAPAFPPAGALPPVAEVTAQVSEPTPAEAGAAAALGDYAPALAIVLALVVAFVVKMGWLRRTPPPAKG